LIFGLGSAALALVNRRELAPIIVYSANEKG
jgi:hypothetical protein